ncbi:MAG: flagellar basal body P-ring formation protein FlgA [Nitrospirae bacterium]|nr:flagellar basal body P-ring formation protein FlgA [Nitrospirota bacterium]
MVRTFIGWTVVGLLLVCQPAQAGSSAGKAGPSNGPSKSGAPVATVQPSAAQPSKEPPKPVMQEVTVEQVRLTLQRYVEKQVEGKVGEVQVRLLNLPDPVTVPAGLLLEVRVADRGLEEGLGRRIFQIALAVDGTQVQTLRVMAEVSATAEVVTASRYIKPEETIQAEDLAMATVQLPALVHDFVTSLDLVVGKRAVRPLRAGTPVRLSAISAPFVIKRGDQVTIEVKRGGLLIQASGTTKTNGQIGQSITVTNLDSGKEIRGQVVGPGVVRVGF